MQQFGVPFTEWIIIMYLLKKCQNLLYFRIFNNKYIEMPFKSIKIMLCPIFKKKDKAKYSQFSLFLYIETA